MATYGVVAERILNLLPNLKEPQVQDWKAKRSEVVIVILSSSCSHVANVVAGIVIHPNVEYIWRGKNTR